MNIRILSFLVFVACALSAGASTPPASRSIPPAFEPNIGQVTYMDGSKAPHVDATLSIAGATAFVHPTGMHVVLHRMHEKVHVDSAATMDLIRVDVDLIGSNQSARIEYKDKADGFIRHIRPGDSALGTVTNRWNSVVYHNVYRGIDMRITATPHGPKVDFIVQPGADPSLIALRYHGAQSISSVKDGGIAASTQLGWLYEQAPVSWTEDAMHRREVVASAFVLNGNSVRFKLGEYDNTKPLTIDPQRIWATFYGGNNAFEDAFVAMDPFGNCFMAGATTATNLPKNNGVFQKNYKGKTDAYVVKFNFEGNLVWHTYIGGTGSDKLTDISPNDIGELWICGYADSANHPLFDLDVLGSGPIGGLDGDTLTDTQFGYVMRVKADGSWGDSWLLDSDNEDRVTGISCKNNRLAIVGTTRSRKLLNGVTGNPYARNPTNNYGFNDAFICRLVLKPNSTDRWDSDWLTYYGGDSDDEGMKVAIDAAGNVTATGMTVWSTNIPVSDGSTLKGAGDCWVIRFATPTPHTPQRSWAGYFGGTGTDRPRNICVDAQGNVILVGLTYSTDFPVANAIQAAAGVNGDGFIRKLASTTGAVTFSTYFGGNGSEDLLAVTTDKNDRIWLGMSTSNTTNMPVSGDAFQATPYVHPDWQLQNGYFAQLSANGATVLYGSYYCAPPQATLPPPPGMAMPPPPIPPETDFGHDYITDIFVDGNAYILLGSNMKSIRMETTAGAYQDSSTLRKDEIVTSNFLALFTMCKDSTINVIVNGKTTLCPNDSRQLLAPVGFDKYQWSNGATTRIINVTDSGRYVVTCTTVEGCKYKDTVVMTRNPNPTVSVGPDVSGCINTLITLTATPTGGTPPYSYKWKRIESGPSYIDDDTKQSPGVNPNTTSRYFVTLTDSAGCTAVDTIKVTIIDPKPKVNPTSLDFGSLGPCETSIEIDIVLKNPETYAIALNEFQSNWAVIGLVTSISPPLSIPAGDSATLRLRVSPSTPGVTSGTFVLKGLPCGWQVVVPFTVTRQKLLASVSPTAVDYGTAPDCQTINADTTIVIRNGSVDQMNLSAPQVALPFTATLSSITIAPGDSVTLSVNYAPVVNGTFIDIVRIPFSAGFCSDTLKVDVRGARFAVAVSTQPTTINFGTLEGCEDERDTVVMIYNQGSVPLLADLQSTTDVIYAPTGVVAIPANDSLQVTITIRPSAPGAFAATVDVPIEPCGLKVTYNLSAQKSSISFVTPPSVDMGEIVSCRDGNSITRSFSVQFNGTGTSTVSAVLIGAEFSTTLVPGTTFANGIPQTFDVRWSPTAEGAMVDSMVLTFEPCSIQRTIYLNGTASVPSIVAAVPTIVITNAPAVTTGTLEFLNNGSDTLKVLVTAVTPNVTISNQVPTPQTDILPGETVSVDFVLQCNGRDTFLDSIVAVVSTPCVLSASTEFSGTCSKQALASATIVIDTAAVVVGENFKLPMRITSSTGLEQTGLRNWRADITFDPMVMVGTGATPDCYVEGVYTPCTITVNGTRTDTIGTLFEFDFTAVLGPRSLGNVEISSFTWLDDPTMVSTTSNGYVRITDICEAGGTRLLNPKANAFSISIFPNPASTQFTIRVLGLGQQPGTWKLHNYIGTQVASGALVPDAQGNAELIVPVDTYGSGTYFVTIDARGSIYRTPLVIIH